MMDSKPINPSHLHHVFLLAVAIVSMCCCTLRTEAAPITLAHDGKPAATIVIPANASDRASQAANELQHYVRKICGVELPIHRDGKLVAGTGLYIDRCEPSLDSDLPDAKLNPETYAIRVRNGNLFFAGRYPTPVWFAVVSFIEDILGVRWFAPGDEWEYVPACTLGELKIDPHEIVKTPGTSPRFWHAHSFTDAWNAWGARNKTMNGERAPRCNFQNNLYLVFPPSKYAKSHPEYYPLIDGKRWIPKEDYRYWRPCESNPDVIRLTVEAARRHFDEHPGSDSFSLGMDDISHLCGCPQCRALDPHPNSYEKREFSDRHYKFVNTVAREIARTHPGRYIGTLIYSITRKPPETVDRLEDNVFGYITEVSAQWCLPGRRQEDHALTREWARRCKHLSRYDYFGLGTFTPRYYPHWMAEQIQFDKSLGMEGMFSELNTFLPHTAPMIWAFAKMEWDSSLNIDALLNEFMTKMFGRAAPAMGRYFDLLERAWNNPPPGRTDWEHRNLFVQARAISPEAVDQGLSILKEAAAQADQDIVRRRIDTIRAALQYAGYAIQENALSEKLIPVSVDRAGQAADVMNDSLRIMQLSAERETFWTAAMQREDIFGENLRGLAGRNYLMIGRVRNLERGAGVGALRVLDWYARNDPGQLPAATTKLTSSVKCNLSDTLRAWLWLQTNKPVNLLENGGFDQPVAVSRRAGDSPPYQDGQLLPNQPVPPAGWSTDSLSLTAKLWTEPKAGRAGTVAACIANAESGIYLQKHDVKPGERYLCVAHVSARPNGTDAKGYLGVRFQKPDGAWYPRIIVEPQVYMITQPGWQPLMLLATIPEGAGRIVILLGAKDQPADATALFDDVGLYRLPEGW